MRTKMNHQRVAAAVLLGLLLTFLPNAALTSFSKGMTEFLRGVSKGNTEEEKKGQDVRPGS